ncbi:MAG: DUF1493 family protein [Flavobacteriales bacterium]|nr:DUF1493 family protein [Flavobacteriales bacterium]
MESVTLKNKIITFLKQRCGDRINEASVFFEGSGVNGHDAYLLMSELEKEFNIDMATFKPHKYFSDEADLLNPIKRIFNYYVKKSEHLTFDIDHLVDVIEKGQWFDPNSKIGNNA